MLSSRRSISWLMNSFSLSAQAALSSDQGDRACGSGSSGVGWCCSRLSADMKNDASCAFRESMVFAFSRSSCMADCAMWSWSCLFARSTASTRRSFSKCTSSRRFKSASSLCCGCRRCWASGTGTTLAIVSANDVLCGGVAFSTRTKLYIFHPLLCLFI
jgi:hypothetical protein